MHPEMIERMMRWLDQDAPDEKRELQSHLMECAGCAREWAALLAAQQQLTNARLLVPAPGFAGRVMQRLAQRQDRRAKDKTFLALPAFVLGSLILTALTLYLSPLGLFLAPDGLSYLVNAVLVLASLFTAFERAAAVIGPGILDHVNQWTLLLTAFVTLGLTIAWARLVTGMTLDRPIS
ncbi:MAG TPA: hypothetical protein VIX58_00010 [Anaerolineae bacterium]